MAKAAEHLTDEDILALSAYYAGLPPEPSRD
jgi:cytochrome c553